MRLNPRWLAWAMVALLAVVPIQFADGQKSRAKKVQTLNKNLKSVKEKKAAIQSQLRQTKRAAKEVVSDIARADERLGSLEDRVADTQNKLERGRVEQERLTGELKVVNAKLGAKKVEMRKRLKHEYMRPSGSVLTAIVKSESLGELASRRALLEMVARKDRELFDEVKDLCLEAEQKKRRQDALVQEIANLVARQKAEQAELKVAKKQKEGYLVELREQQSELQDQYDELEQESRSIEAQIRAYQAARQNSGQAVTAFRGSLMMPVSGGRVGSGFGMRFHPILKRSRMHTGVDIGAASGTPIKAAGPGVVISASYRGGYGNCVMIDHGGGLSTLYGHCSKLYVRAGQTVKRGQVIAAVGSTGLSTGPHLHFETRINGRPVNPTGRL
ncbi:MAG: peptidoglycan DD-metalloendopeptidase family protein [Fimbriimonadaceae bacterium]|nr:peptidoglycan DD-metalloendopeptidase family protein [Fimbriimonadaceae bacterium]